MEPVEVTPPRRVELSIQQLGDIFARSGYFKDARDASQAIVKVLYGREIGLPPVVAMSGIYIVEGKPTLSAALMAAKIRSSGLYDYEVARHDDQGCEIAFFDLRDGGRKEMGRSSFTLDDAKTAGLAGKNNWRQYPRNMTYARAMANGARWYCPDLFGGPVYIPEELGLEVDETGEVQVRTLPKTRAVQAEKVDDGTPLTEAQTRKIAQLAQDLEIPGSEIPTVATKVEASNLIADWQRKLNARRKEQAALTDERVKAEIVKGRCESVKVGAGRCELTEGHDGEHLFPEGSYGNVLLDAPTLTEAPDPTIPNSEDQSRAEAPNHDEDGASRASGDGS